MNLFSNQFQHISLSLNIAETILIIVRMELKKIRERKKQKERTKKKRERHLMFAKSSLQSGRKEERCGRFRCNDAPGRKEGGGKLHGARP